VIFIRLNTTLFDAYLVPPTNASLFYANSNLTYAQYHIYGATGTNGTPKTILAVSDGVNWTILSFNN